MFTSTVAEVARVYLMPVENRSNLMTEVATKGIFFGQRTMQMVADQTPIRNADRSR